MADETQSNDGATAKDAPLPQSFPGERLYENSRRVLFLCFFTVFLLTAHQHFFTPLQRSKTKLIMLLCILPFLVIGGLCCAFGWWKMRRAGAFRTTHSDRKERSSSGGRGEGKRRRDHGDDLELLPWQRRDRD